MTPNDPDAYVGDPPLYCLKYDEIHVSVAFTWDVTKAETLAANWGPYGVVQLGGPAYDDSCGEFEPGRYLRKGIVITSRGCPNNCPWCFVPQREGSLRELPIQPGYIIQDNNLLACSKVHTTRVFQMLRAQKRAVIFSGGFEAARLHTGIVEELRSIRIKEVWLSYDSVGEAVSVLRAIQRLRTFLSLRQVRCYVLIGYEGDTIENAERRLEWVFSQGAMPFAMRYRTPSTVWQDSFIYPEREWNLLQRRWTRPAIMMSSILRKD